MLMPPERTSIREAMAKGASARLSAMSVSDQLKAATSKIPSVSEQIGLTRADRLVIQAAADRLVDQRSVTATSSLLETLQKAEATHRANRALQHQLDPSYSALKIDTTELDRLAEEGAEQRARELDTLERIANGLDLLAAGQAATDKRDHLMLVYTGVAAAAAVITLIVTAVVG